jgi:hypothetical protein
MLRICRSIRTFMRSDKNQKWYQIYKRYLAYLLLDVVGVRRGHRSSRIQIQRKIGWASQRICPYSIGITRQGVKTYPISKKILLISALTFSSWWKAPPDVGVPSASKLYFLNFATFHAPLMRQISASLDTKVRLANLASISAVKSVSGFSLETLKSEPLETENH